MTPEWGHRPRFDIGCRLGAGVSNGIGRFCNTFEGGIRLASGRRRIPIRFSVCADMLVNSVFRVEGK